MKQGEAADAVRGFACFDTVKKDVADTMKLKTKTLLVVLLLGIMILTAGCAPEVSPYEVNDSQGYNVSIVYDANGGTFTTNTSIITDSYNVSEVPVKDGKAQIALISPDNPVRGNDAFEAVNSGYFLAGWYQERRETADGYTYSGRWDFEQDILQIEADGSYSASEPVMTLYAAWVPMFEFEFYSLETGEYLDSYSFNPMVADRISVPSWDQETGAIEMHRFPERSGYTFDSVYSDENGKQKIDGSEIVHLGQVDYETGTATDAVMPLYISWMEGEWYHIYNVEQFLDNASVSGSYVIHEDLDFTGEIWPSSMMYGNYTGTIEGNGHTFSNIELTQTNNSKTNAGLFGYLTEEASVSDLNLENVTLTIQSGTRVAGTSYGLLAGSISDKASVSGVSIANSKILIDSGCYFGVDDYSIGLLCGIGSADVDYSGITCEATGDNPESVVITVEDNDVTVEFVTE